MEPRFIANMCEKHLCEYDTRLRQGGAYQIVLGVLL
jgi:hypothetical protein